MKKLLSLLSVLTISGATMPSVIAANSYEKKEKNENINHERQKRSSYKMNTKIVMKTNGIIYSSGIILNNKLYFGSEDHNVYEYDPATGQQKVIIKSEGNINSSGIILNNKLYFGSHDNNVYEYDPNTGQQKIVIKTNGKIDSSGVVLNKKLYLGSHDNNVYEYDPATEQQKVVMTTNATNNWIYSSGVVLNNKIYIGVSDGNVYEYDSNTGQQKIVIKTNSWIICHGLVLNNKIYFGSTDYNVYEYDPNTGQQKIVIKSEGQIWYSGAVLNNKLYFGSDDNNVYEYDPNTGQQKIVIKTNGWVRAVGVVLNNKLYTGSFDNNVYEYDPNTGQQKIVMTTSGWIASSGIVLNNKIYFGTSDHNVYEYSEYDLNSNLGEINDNSNYVILNELNYLNPSLDISQLEIINRTNNSANVKIKNNLSNNIINVKYSINNEENKIINLNELIKRALFFKYRDENTNLKFKEIKDIDINNLKFTNVEVTKKENSFLKHRDIKNTCSNKEFINNTSNVKSFNIPACVYNSKYKLTFQILTGLTKKNEENKLNGWNINSDDEMRLSDFVSTNYNENNEIVNELSNNFDLSNTNKQEQEMIIYYLNDSADKFNVNPNEKLQINYSSLKTTKYKNMLNLKQKIIGTINAKIINYSDKEQIVTLSIKEAMQILQKYSLLPDEISINEDNNIIFNGKASILSEIEGQIKSNIVFSIV